MNFTITKEMIKNSLVNKGDVARIVEVIRKANSGQDISIAFLGGSITEDVMQQDLKSVMQVGFILGLKKNLKT